MPSYNDSRLNSVQQQLPLSYLLLLIYRAPKPLHLSVDVRITIELDNVELANDFIEDSVALGVLCVAQGGLYIFVKAS
jgi:hypothetical protein